MLGSLQQSAQDEISSDLHFADQYFTLRIKCGNNAGFNEMHTPTVHF